jgi:hypothetical protein
MLSGQTSKSIFDASGTFERHQLSFFFALVIDHHGHPHGNARPSIRSQHLKLRCATFGATKDVSAKQDHLFHWAQSHESSGRGMKSDAVAMPNRDPTFPGAHTDPSTTRKTATRKSREKHRTTAI